MEHIHKSATTIVTHLYVIDEVKAGVTEKSKSVWIDINSGVQTLTIFMDSDDKDIKNAFEKMHGLIRGMENAVTTAENKYFKK